MRKRVFIRFNDPERKHDLHSIAERLRDEGFEVTDIASIAGQITGTFDEGNIEKLQRNVESLGGHFDLEETEPTHGLPDPQSRILPTRKGFLQGYNAQLAVSADHLIIAVNLSQSPNDQASFPPMMHAAE